MVSDSNGSRAVGWLAGVVLVAGCAGVTGCSNGEGSTAEHKNSGAEHKSSSAEKTPTAKSSPSSPRSATRRSSAEGAVAAWVTAVVKDRPREACLVMADPAEDSAAARVGTPATCNRNTPKGRQMLDSIGRFHASFTPKHATGDPKVRVAEVQATGDEAVVPADKVVVDGQTLDKVILSNSTGLEPGQLDVKMESTRIKGAWYVTNLDFNVG